MKDRQGSLGRDLKLFHEVLSHHARQRADENVPGNSELGNRFRCAWLRVIRGLTSGHAVCGISFSGFCISSTCRIQKENSVFSAVFMIHVGASRVEKVIVPNEIW